MQDEANLALGPFVEGLIFGALDWPRLESGLLSFGWTLRLTELDRHAVVLESPSGIQWRIVAQLVPEDGAG